MATTGTFEIRARDLRAPFAAWTSTRKGPGEGISNAEPGLQEFRGNCDEHQEAAADAADDLCAAGT